MSIISSWKSIRPILCLNAVKSTNSLLVTCPTLNNSETCWINWGSTRNDPLCFMLNAYLVTLMLIGSMSYWNSSTRSFHSLTFSIMKCTTRTIDSGRWWSEISTWWDARLLEFISIRIWRTRVWGSKAVDGKTPSAWRWPKYTTTVSNLKKGRR